MITAGQAIRLLQGATKDTIPFGTTDDVKHTATAEIAGQVWRSG